MEQATIFKVSTETDPNSLAGAIANTVREGTFPALQAIGAGAVNAAVKSIAIANGFLAPSGTMLAALPTFQDLNLDGQERTAMLLKLKQMG